MLNDFQEQLLDAYNKTSTSTQKKYNFIYLAELIESLNSELLSGDYKPKRFSCFVVKEPKVREIFAPDFQDRLVQHILIDKISPILDRRFIYDSYANRKNKGTHKAVKRLQSFMRKQQNKYFIQLDIKSFFPSIDKQILITILEKHFSTLDIKNKEFYLNLAQTIILQNPTKPTPVFTGNKHLLKEIPQHKSLFHTKEGKGLPIGSLSSQFFSNLYLNELDQFIKHQLKVKYYVRYVDDFILLADNPKQLNTWRNKIHHFLQKTLKLQLHPKKIILNKVSKGIDFLGYIVFKNYLLVRKRVVKEFKNKLKFFNYLLTNKNKPQKIVVTNFVKKYHKPQQLNGVFLQDMLGVLNAYYGIFTFANSFNLRKDLYHNYFHNLKQFFVVCDSGYNNLMIRKYWNYYL